MLLADAFEMYHSIMNNFAEFDDSARFSGVDSFVRLLANTFIIVAVGLSVAALAFGFVQMATSSGDPKNAERAQRAILWGALGIFIALIAYVLKNVLINAAGISSTAIY